MPGAEPIDLAFAGAGWIAAVHGYAVDHVPGPADQPRRVA